MATEDFAFSGGKPVHPAKGSFPILHPKGNRRLAVVGTGFWITSYGLFVTAAHVVDEFIADDRLTTAFALHLASETTIHLRKITCVARLNAVDLAICQANNYLEKYPNDPLMNLRVRLTTTAPKVGSKLVTYAYPQNGTLDLSDSNDPPELRGDRFEGKFLREVESSERPFIPYPHFETSIEVKSGASGGPVFDDQGRVVGVNCRGWDFAGSEFEGENLSSIVPIAEAMQAEIMLNQLPANSWEAFQVPVGRRDKPITFAELVVYRHIAFDL